MTDPFQQFATWMDRAVAAEPDVPEAAALATCGADGCPSVRMVLVKAVDRDGAVFYTNLGSQKASDIADNPRASLCFHWKSLHRQVRFTGRVQPVSEAQADAYFATRARLSQIGAWASKQSQPQPTPIALETQVAAYLARFGVGPVPRPPWWSGFRVVPHRIEFWEERPYRAHRRVVYTLEDGDWVTARLYP